MNNYLQFLKKQFNIKVHYLEFLISLFSVIIGLHLVILKPFNYFEHYRNIIKLGFNSNEIGVIILVSTIPILIKSLYLDYKFRNMLLALILKLPILIVFLSCFILVISYSTIPLSSILFLLMVCLTIDSILSE